VVVSERFVVVLLFFLTLTMVLMTAWFPDERSYEWYGPYAVLSGTRTHPEKDNGCGSVRCFTDSGRTR
jgi:hypothetical protein